MTQRFCVDLADIPPGSGRGILLSMADGELPAVVIHYGGEIRVYINRCPHTGISLNWAEDQFFDVDHNFIQCSLHGALFEPLSGHCVWGPCLNKDLQSLPFELVDQQVVIYI